MADPVLSGSTSGRSVHTMQTLPSASLQAATAARDAKLAEFAERRFARAIHVPVDDDEVKLALRARSHPVCLFGEDVHDRRERLRALIAADALSANAPAPPGAPPKGPLAVPAPAAEPAGADYYTEGDASLRALRAALARSSLAAAANRLADEWAAREEGDGGPLRTQLRAKEAATIERVRASSLRASQRTDGRPLSAIGLCGGCVATGSFGGTVEIWDAASCERRGGVAAHAVRVSMVNFANERTVLAAAADGTASRIRVGDDGVCKVAHVYEGHEGRVAATCAHPIKEDVVLTAGFDGTLRLFSGEYLLATHETGHAQATWLALHPDGSLFGTTGSEGGVRLWDIRSGRVILTLERAHVGQALRVAFAGDGRTFATAGGDHAAAVWDLRRRASVKRIAAHRGIVSGLAFCGGGGDVLVTASFDGTVKCWAARREFAMIQAHTAHEDKVMAIDVTGDAGRVVTACYDKTWKSWEG